MGSDTTDHITLIGLITPLLAYDPLHQGSLVVRAPDRNAWVRCPYHQIPSEYTRNTCSLNQWVRKSCGLNHECRELEKIDGRAIYRNVLSFLPEFHRDKSYCHLYGAQG
ncbi:hypothetical protein TNCV_2173811 [Trichonephila clavipes]|nr:hypothetical protein TNCV_2173811 [Trichonephila clavipes]